MWYTATSASVTTGATVVAVTTGDDISIIQEDSGLIFEGESPVQVKRGYIDGFGDKFIELASPWPYTDKVAQPIVAYPTDASFAEATAELRRVIDTLEVASTVDMQAATNDTKIATPLKVKQAIDFNTGTAATRDVGESAGNLMEVGAFGLGALSLTPATQQEIDDYLFGKNLSMYSIVNPTSLPPATYIITIYRFGGSNVHQVIRKVDVDDTSYERIINTTTGINSWKKVYNTGNMLGTVSQSGGVPTGAIIERGSNANGEYTKYADGTMICFNCKTTLNPGLTGTISLPAQFVGVAHAFGNNFGAGSSYTTNWFVLIKNNTQTPRVDVSWEAGLSTANSQVVISAIGRWY